MALAPKKRQTYLVELLGEKKKREIVGEVGHTGSFVIGSFTFISCVPFALILLLLRLLLRDGGFTIDQAFRNIYGCNKLSSCKG